MLRLIFFTLAALSLIAPAAVVQADVTVYVEDFEDDGESGFDPLFNHKIEASPYSSYPENWDFVDNTSSPEHGIVIAMWPAQDTISFFLEPYQEVVFASVEVRSWVPGTPSDACSIDFIGRDGWRRVLLDWTGEWETIGLSSEEIGPICQIQMRSYEGYFDNVTIHVIPEPSSVATAIIGFVICLMGMVIKAIQTKN